MNIENFKNFLISEGYKTETPSGNPSTVYDYSKRLYHVAERENISLNALYENIDKYVFRYDASGEESEFGNKSNRAVINALKRLRDFKISNKQSFNSLEKTQILKLKNPIELTN